MGRFIIFRCATSKHSIYSRQHAQLERSAAWPRLARTDASAAKRRALCFLQLTKDGARVDFTVTFLLLLCLTGGSNALLFAHVSAVGASSRSPMRFVAACLSRRWAAGVAARAPFEFDLTAGDLKRHVREAEQVPIAFVKVV